MSKLLLLLLLALLGTHVCFAEEGVEETPAAAESSEPQEEDNKPIVITRPPPEDPTGDVNKFDDSQLEVLQTQQKQYDFQAEVTRLMDIIINSLYKEREIFLRELISNSADALDKVRFVKLQKGEIVDESSLWIHIKPDKTAKTLTISDTGIGMTKDELINNLGVVARSGTTEFLEAATKGGSDALTLIGQFGVGFYSVYLVADRVTVVSKHDDDNQHIWQSNADRTFSVAADPRGNTIPRGTSVIIHLKGDAEEFLEQNKLEALITRYSQFISYPISLYTHNTLNTEIPDPKKEAEKKRKQESGELELGEEEEEEQPSNKIPEIPKYKTEQWEEWKLMNPQKAIWMRNPKEVEPKEYEEFYKTLTKENTGYLTKIHFKAEGEIAFRSILYVPKQAEWGLYDKFYEKSTALKLFVRKVLISDQFDDFLPKYLNFVKGVVDSDDLPLQVSRETLAQNKVLKVMAKKITRKVLEMLTRLAEGKKEATEDGEEESEEGVEITNSKEDYETFWKHFGKSIKLGIIDDRSNRPKLAKLLRYVTSKSDGELTTLEQYVQRMKEDQKYIYYITGESIEAVKDSPMLERLKKLDLEVIFMVDPLDEYVVNSLTEYDGNQLMSVTKKDLKIPGVDDNVETLQKEHKKLCSHLSKLYGKRVEKVEVGTRITDSPAVIVTGQYGWTANMERIMRAQTFADADKHSYMHSKKTMEINPSHPIIKEFKARVDAGVTLDDQGFNDLANLVYDAALINSGFPSVEPHDFANRIHRVVSIGLGLDPESLESSSQKPTEKDQSDENLHEEL